MNPSLKKILLVDDDARNIFALSAVLRSRGYQCIAASNGADGLKHLDLNPDIGLLLLDMMMPEMDGYEVISRIRESERKQIPIVAVTAQAMAGDMEKCIEAGADAYISKPVDVDKLFVLIEKLNPAWQKKSN